MIATATMVSIMAPLACGNRSTGVEADTERSTTTSSAQPGRTSQDGAPGEAEFKQADQMPHLGVIAVDDGGVHDLVFPTMSFDSDVFTSSSLTLLGNELESTGGGAMGRLGLDAPGPFAFGAPGGEIERSLTGAKTNRDPRFVLASYSGSSLTGSTDGTDQLGFDDGSSFTLRSITTPYGEGVIAFGEPLDGQVGILFVGLSEEERLKMLMSLGTANPVPGASYRWLPSDLVAEGPRQVHYTQYQSAAPGAALTDAPFSNVIVIDSSDSITHPAADQLASFISPHSFEDEHIAPLPATQCEEVGLLRICAWISSNLEIAPDGSVQRFPSILLSVSNGERTVTAQMSGVASESELSQEKRNALMQRRLDLMATTLSGLRPD